MLLANCHDCGSDWSDFGATWVIWPMLALALLLIMAALWLSLSWLERRRRSAAPDSEPDE